MSFFDSISVITLVGLREVIFPAFFLTMTSCKCDMFLQRFNIKKFILWYVLAKILSDFEKLCKLKYYV